MNNPSGNILLELLLSPDTPSELFLEYKKQLLSYLAAGEEAVKKVAELENKLTSIVRWLEKNQSDVFSRGLWDAMGQG